MKLTKEWTKDWANEAERASNGLFVPRGDERMGKANSIRFPQSVQKWLEEESDRRGVKFAEVVRECVTREIERSES